MKKIIGIGNALTDVLAKVDDDKILAELNLPKGSMQLIGEPQLPAIRQAMSQMTASKATGGSAGNSMLALANLGAKPGFIGKIGNDETGSFYASNAAAKGIVPTLVQSTLPSGIAHTFITPDGERTFATFLGAAGSMEADDLKADMFEGYDYLYIEGYLVQNHALILHAIQLAKEKGLKVCIDLASYNIVAAEHDFFEELLTKYIDIVFANKEEAIAYTGKQPDEALEQLAKTCEIAIVKLGEKGSSVMYKGEKTFVGCSKINVVDTTGAGDFYAGGFMYGVLQGWSMERCAKAGTLLAGHVIQTVGTALPETEWEEIRTAVKNL
ncbi:MAG: adenosine kinase [Bacteroidaceae bacterium]|nr:adenosine kinase [Bacteroidaceae bacterium]